MVDGPLNERDLYLPPTTYRPESKSVEKQKYKTVCLAWFGILKYYSALATLFTYCKAYQGQKITNCMYLYSILFYI